MANVLFKKCLFKAQRGQHYSFYRSWNGSVECSKLDRFSAPSIKYHLGKSELLARFTHTGFRKATIGSSTRSAVPSDISTRASSSSQKLGFVAWYLGKLKTRPISTKSITAALIYAAADVSSQVIVGETRGQYDVARTLRMAGYGMLILGPTLHYWYNFMSRVFPKCDLLSTFKKMTLGQTIYGPAMTVIFFSVNAAFRGESGSEIVARLKRDLLPTMINGVMYWPICDFLTFRFVPVHLQPLLTNSFSYLWTVYMTHMASLAKASES